MAPEMKAATPLVNVLRASLRAERNPLCKALDEVFGQCDLSQVEQCVREACEKFKQDQSDDNDLTLHLANVLVTQFSNSAKATERMAAHLVQGMLFKDVYELQAIMEDIVYPMYLDPDDIRASVLE